MTELVSKIFPICGCASANNIRKGLPCLRRIPKPGDQCADHKNKGWALSTVTVSEANTRQAPSYGVLSFHNGNWYIQRYKCCIDDCKKPRANFTKTCIVHSHANKSRKAKRADIDLVDDEDDDDNDSSSNSSSYSSSAESEPNVSKGLKFTMKKLVPKNLPQKKRSLYDSNNGDDADDNDAADNDDADNDEGSIHDPTEIVRLKRQVGTLNRKVSSLTNTVNQLTTRMDHMEDKKTFSNAKSHHTPISRSEPSGPPLPVSTAFKIVKPPPPPTVVGVPFASLMSQPTPGASLPNVNELLEQEVAVRMNRMQSSLEGFTQRSAPVSNRTEPLTKESLFQLWQEFLNSKE